MAKKKKASDGAMCAPTEYKPPTRAQIIKSESRYLGQRIAESSPAVKKMRDEISRSVEQAVKKALSGKAKQGHFE